MTNFIFNMWGLNSDKTNSQRIINAFVTSLFIFIFMITFILFMSRTINYCLYLFTTILRQKKVLLQNFNLNNLKFQIKFCIVWFYQKSIVEKKTYSGIIVSRRKYWFRLSVSRINYLKAPQLCLTGWNEYLDISSLGDAINTTTKKKRLIVWLTLI